MSCDCQRLFVVVHRGRVDDLDFGGFQHRVGAEGVIEGSWSPMSETLAYETRNLVRMKQATLLALRPEVRGGVPKCGRKGKTETSERDSREVENSGVIEEVEAENGTDEMLVPVYIDVQIGQPILIREVVIKGV